MIAAAVHCLGSILYRLAFFAAGLYLLWRAATDTDSLRILTSLGLGSLCMLQFAVLAVIDYRRARRRAAARARLD